MTTLTKTEVKPTWSQTKVQEETVNMAAAQCAAAFQALSKVSPEALADYQQIARQFKVASLKAKGVTNALQLVTALAETEVNLFGSKIEVGGDEKEATMTYQHCAMWDAIKKLNKMTPEQEGEMGAKFQACMQSLAQEMGLNATVKFEGETCNVCFAKA